MGCRRKMWLCLSLWYALIYVEYAHGKHVDERSKFFNITFPLAQNSTSKLSKVNRESENNYVGLTAATGLSNGEPEHFQNFHKLNKSIPIVVPDEDESKSRIGYEKDLMLVLPVNSNTNGSDLQMWYTQSPITEIIEERSTAKLEHQAYDVYEERVDDDRHPYTNFLINKPSKKPQKSPLDYGYPESFKFVEDLNGLPSNHKPEWASTDVIDLEEASTKMKVTTESISTKRNPFEMFESVKPLEINKLLSLQQMLQTTSSESEEYATEKKNISESYIRTVPKRPTKWPTKKPQRTKLTTESTTTESEPQINTSAPIYPMDSDQLYTAVRYTTLLSQSTKEFLPNLHSNKNKPIVGTHGHHFESFSTTTTTTTPRTSTSTTTEAITLPKITTTTTTTTIPTPIYRRSTTMKISEEITTTRTPTTITTKIPPPTTTSTTISNSIADIVVYNVTEDTDEEVPLSVDSFDLTPSQNTSDFPAENFQPPKDMNFHNLGNKPDDLESMKEGNPPISGDMLTNDMKNMLIALGILKPEETKPTSSTEKVTVRKEPVTPNIDANSYTSFKKIPIDYKQQSEKGTISDDMKDLLASFGLLPKKTFLNESTGTRISRQQNLTEINSTNSEVSTDLPFSFTEEISTESETNFPNFAKANSSQTTPDVEAEVADFFHNENSSYGSENPINVNSEMLTDEMKNTLETLGLLKESSLTNRSPKSAHVFQPTSQLEKFNKDDNAKKITDVLRTIQKLSIRTESNDISAEELEKQLQNLTATLDSEQFAAMNETFLFELNEILTNDTNLKIIESIENMTKKVESNKTLTTTETYTILDNFTITNQTQPTMKPPSPLSTDELLQLYEMGKNEIKRQQPNSTSTSTTSEQPQSTFPSAIDDASIPGTNTETFMSNTEVPSINTSSASTTSTSLPTSSEIAPDTKVEANNNAPVADLADSFGGAEIASEDPSADDLPTPKPNGLYFYLDWNTFLNVGEEDKNPVRIRFAPRAGNARNFLPITVP